MKQELDRIVRATGSEMEAWNRCRDYLQVRILELMQDTGAMIPLAFCGGTALRMLYALPRFSEDLDFSLERDRRNFRLDTCVKRVARGLSREGYDVSVMSRAVSTVQSHWLRFPGLPWELGLSPRPNRVLAIKVDVDTHPPDGAGLVTHIVRSHRLLRLQHHDRPSLLAGKLHAVLMRGYPKGRDYYDLLWYMGDRDWPAPNLILLGNALRQTGWSDEQVESMDLERALREKFASIDWSAVRRDVAPFLERTTEADLLNREDMTAVTAGFLRERRG